MSLNGGWVMLLSVLSLVVLMLIGDPVHADTGGAPHFELYGETGNSVLFPGVEFEKSGDDWWELKKPGAVPDWVAQYHGGYLFHNHYRPRVDININGSLLLKNLIERDTGEYEHLVNGHLQAKIILHVIEPVNPPILWIQARNKERCQVVLVCQGQSGLNRSFVKDGDGILGNITFMGNSTILTIDGTNPQLWGRYSCRQWNPVSLKFSNPVNVQKPGKLPSTL
ncbi:hypothetical protein GDO86_000034 [Hymenochirus boettgeri]|uniref:Uncharacterized protein n=1 Tax=Hymenochirus boettgeri TaxID=247094 RepID=A0A8T2K9G3_9PIPI|nr:hypothetical protein GDO86_000034 [Hymenochirus boettgeri]